MSATKYLDLTGLQYFKTKMDAKYVTSADVETAISSALETYKQGIVTIVSSLPAFGEEGLLYLVPDSNASSNDVYTTWAWEENSWAQMGASTFGVTVDSTVIEDSTNPVSGGAVYDELASKLDASELTSSIAEDGTNAVTSGAIYDALDLKLDASELTSSISNGGTNAVTSGAIYDALDLKLDASELTSSISDGGTNAVTSGAIYDALDLKLDASELTSNITQYGTNAVTSGAIYDALALKLDSADVESIENSDIDALFV